MSIIYHDYWSAILLGLGFVNLFVLYVVGIQRPKR